MLFSTTLLPPMAVSAWYHDGEITHFSISFGTALVIGLFLWWPWHRHELTIGTRDGFAVVALMWTAMSVLGAIPFVLGLHLDFVDALFEAASGYTTTGATVLVGLDDLSPSILLYRTEIQWLGGIGVIVLAVALLPMLGVGGMQLYRAEVPGPLKDERMTPRIARSARSLSALYIGFTALCALCYWLAGMTPLDAVSNSFSTLSTGGYSNHDASFAYYDSPLMEAIAEVFMLVGGISFSVHFVAWRALSLRLYGQDTQTKAFLLTIAGLIAVAAGMLLATRVFEPLVAFRYSIFEVISVVTTTGYGITDFSSWPLALPVLLIFSTFVGGCAGSTAGGIKVMRFVVLAKQGAVHLRRLIHPHSVQPIRVDERVVPEGIIEGIWGFFTVYIAAFVALMLVLMLDGLDQVTAFSAIAACLNNAGAGLGEVSLSFVGVDEFGKVVCIVAMLLGRLEIFTLLVLLTPSFWRR
ncbi:MAG TPA: TrkH family potassium uptake protein [Gammaproteobacteria bacterium]|nr:TrkH family potassium uptake protein [Gammaproteobacteria bacterium]